jgi:hypothetical protein
LNISGPSTYSGPGVISLNTVPSPIGSTPVKSDFSLTMFACFQPP